MVGVDSDGCRGKPINGFSSMANLVITRFFLRALLGPGRLVISLVGANPNIGRCLMLCCETLSESARYRSVFRECIAFLKSKIDHHCY